MAERVLCADVTDDGLHCPPIGPHCMHAEVCRARAACSWRKFHGLDWPAYRDKHRRRPTPQQQDLAL